MRRAQTASTISILAVTLVLGACKKDQPGPTYGGEGAASQPAAAADSTRAVATLQAKSGSSVSGTATLEQVESGVKITIAISGASPGKHAVHAHENGDCSADDGKSAGGHYNPHAHPHALPDASPRHLGDFGNIEVDEGGRGQLEFLRVGANLKPDDVNSLLGRAVIVHALVDTGEQPTGAAGARIACGVIVAAP